MSSRQKLPPHGTAARYRLERLAGETCPKCRAGVARIRKEQRANHAAADARSKMHIVEAPADDAVNDTKPARTASSRSANPRRKVGTMEKSVDEDIAEIDEALRVPFHRSLSVLAIELAREIDEPATTATARRDARKQLFEVLRSLRTQKEGDDGTALTVLLEQAGFGTPVVPGRRS